MTALTKVVFDVQRDDGATDFESLWALPVTEGYRLDNIPFYVRGFALGDIVAAKHDEMQVLRCSGLVRASGHSTVRLWFARASDVQISRETLGRMGCASELDGTRLVAVDVPPHIQYQVIRAYLEREELSGVLEYEEGCLGFVPPSE